jgi:hypothetical protein
MQRRARSNPEAPAQAKIPSTPALKRFVAALKKIAKAIS